MQEQPQLAAGDAMYTRYCPTRIRRAGVGARALNRKRCNATPGSYSTLYWNQLWGARGGVVTAVAVNRRPKDSMDAPSSCKIAGWAQV